MGRYIRTRFPPCDENLVFTGYGPGSLRAPAIQLLGGDGEVVIEPRPVIAQMSRRRSRSRVSWGPGCLSLMGEGVSDNFAAVVVAREEEEETNGVADSGLHDECVSLVDGNCTS